MHYVKDNPLTRYKIVINGSGLLFYLKLPRYLSRFTSNLIKIKYRKNLYYIYCLNSIYY